jgi:hypothetical protein
MVMLGLLGITSSFGQDVTLKKLYNGIEDIRLEVASRQGSIPDPDPFAQDSLDLRKLLSKNQIKSKQLCNEEIDGPIGNVNVQKIVSGSFTKPETKQRLYTFTRCAFGYGIAILESKELVAVYDSGQAFDAFAIKDINENGLSEFMLEVQSNAKGIWGEMHAIQLLEFPNGKPLNLGSFFIGGPPGYYVNGSDNETCSPNAPRELQKSFPSNIIYVQKGKVPQFFAEGWEVNCDYLEKGVKARKVSSLTPIKPVPRAVLLIRLF